MTETFEPLFVQGSRPVLVFAFGGRGEGRAWEKRLRELDVAFLHFSDSSARWYLDGADGVSGFPAVLDRCRKARAEHEGHRVVSLGQSFGGYAALRIGALMPLNAVVAFAPQTHASRHRHIYAEQRNFGPPGDIFDIRPMLAAGDTPVSIHVSRSERDNAPSAYFWDDHSHLVGLQGFPHIEIDTHDFHQHPTALHIARQGQLSDFLDHEFIRERAPFTGRAPPPRT